MPGNIDLHSRPVVRNGDGSISTVRSMSFGTPQGEVLIPTVVGGRVVSDAEAIAHYKQTGEHLGIFRTADAATAYARQLHEEQGREYLPRSASFADYVFEHGIIPQESGGRAGIPGQQTPYGQPIGIGQMLPGTAQDMARRLGVPFRDDLYRGRSQAAAQYQRMLAREYWNVALQANNGDIRQALMYYYGGPNRSLWGPRTYAYPDDVLRRVRS